MTSERVHRRRNPLTGEHVLVSPHRTSRPWQGDELERAAPPPAYVQDCYLCPGNARAGGAKSNPAFNDAEDSCFVFENDFAAVVPSTAPAPARDDVASLCEEEDQVAIDGQCYVLLYSASHALSMATLPTELIVRVLRSFASLYSRLSGGRAYIQQFENKGSACGASNPHPHAQCWALNYVPDRPRAVYTNLLKYANGESSEALRLRDGRPGLLLDYVTKERRLGTRVVLSGEHFTALVPYWALWPFETIILPHSRHLRSLADLNDQERHDLADVMKRLTIAMDNLFETSFPYSMGIYQAPVEPNEAPEELKEWCAVAQLHICFNPPLLRSATVRKFLVGFEQFAEPQRDITAELAAERLRNAIGPHWAAER